MRNKVICSELQHVVLAAATVKKKVKAKKRRIRKSRKRKSIWVRDWLLKRKKYGLFQKLMNHHVF